MSSADFGRFRYRGPELGLLPCRCLHRLVSSQVYQSPCWSSGLEQSELIDW